VHSQPRGRHALLGAPLPRQQTQMLPFSRYPVARPTPRRYTVPGAATQRA